MFPLSLLHFLGSVDIPTNSLNGSAWLNSLISLYLLRMNSTLKPDGTYFGPTVGSNAGKEAGGEGGCEIMAHGSGDGERNDSREGPGDNTGDGVGDGTWAAALLQFEAVSRKTGAEI